MPHYDDSFLDSPIFRRRAKSYSVLKQDVPKSKTFQITAIPLLLAVTNPTRSFALSTSSCNPQGMAERRRLLETVTNNIQTLGNLFKSISDMQLLVLTWANQEIQDIMQQRDADAATENAASTERPSSSSQSPVLATQQNVQRLLPQLSALMSQQIVRAPSPPPSVPAARQEVRSPAQQPTIQPPRANNRQRRSSGPVFRERPIGMHREAPYYRMYRVRVFHR